MLQRPINFDDYYCISALFYRFPASQFGTLYGLGIFIGGTFGILQYVLFKITSGPLEGDPFWVSKV